MQNAGNQLKDKIKKLKITQEEAARRLGIVRGTLQVWLKKRSFNDQTLKLIRDNLDIVIDNPSEEISEESAAELSKVLEEGFTAKLLNLIQTGELYPKIQVRNLQDDLAEAKKNEGRMEEQIRMLEEELRRLKNK